MPQLDISLFPSQLFWFTICFLVLYVSVLKIILPKISKVFLQRQTHISRAFKISEETRDEAQKIDKDTKSKLSYVKKTTSLAIAETLALLNKQSSNQIKEAEIDLKKMLNISEIELANFKVSATKELNEVIVSSVKKATKDIIGVEVSDDRIRTLIKERQANEF